MTLLDHMMDVDNVDLLPDPISNVIGIIFEKAEADSTERNMSPSSYSKSRGFRDDDTDRELNTPRGIGNLTGRDMSGDNMSLRNKELSATYSKDKNKGTLASITNKYTKLKEVSANELPLKLKASTQASSRIESSGNKLANTSANNGKFSLNLSSIRRVSGQTSKYAPTSGRDKEGLDGMGMSGTLYSERRKNVNTPTSSLNKLNSKGIKYINEKKPASKVDECARDDSNPSILNSIKRKSEVGSTLGSRIKK